MTALMTDAAFPFDQQDSMEITMEKAEDDVDFEIDYDDSVTATYEDEAEMQDDAPQHEEEFDGDIELRSATAEADEDYMKDDSIIPENQVDVDGVMMDAATAVQEDDEELLDLSDDEETTDLVQDTTGTLATSGVTTTESAPIAPAPSQTDFTTVQKDASQEIVEQETKPDEIDDNLSTVEQDAGDTKNVDLEQDLPGETLSRTKDKMDDPQGNDTQFSTSENVHDQEKPQPADRLANDPQEGHGIKGDLIDEATAKGLESLDNLSSLVSAGHENEDGAADSPSSRSADGQQTLTGLHPTVVKYDGGEYLLFPPGEPSEGDEYFLQDENLVSGSINDLLKACRQTLATAMADEDELELYVEGLELHVVEDSVAAFSTSFSELLDIFVQLHHNDGNESPPALVVSLTTRSRFNSRLILLVQAAAAGRGISQALQDSYTNDAPVDYEDRSNEEDASAHGDDLVTDMAATGEAEAQKDASKDSMAPAGQAVDVQASLDDHEDVVDAVTPKASSLADDGPGEGLATEQDLLSFADDDEFIEESHVPADEVVSHEQVVGDEPAIDLSHDLRSDAPSAMPHEPNERAKAVHATTHSVEDAQPGTAEQNDSQLEAQAEQTAASGLVEANEKASAAFVAGVVEDDFDEIDFDDDEPPELDDATAVSQTAIETPSTGSKRRLDEPDDGQPADVKRPRSSGEA